MLGTAITAIRVNGSDLNGTQKNGSAWSLIPVHEVGDARRRLDLGVGHARGFELEKHGHAVAAEAEEDALPEAEDAGIAPAQHQADGDEGVGQILADQIEPEDVDGERQYNHDQHGDQGEADQFEMTVFGYCGRHGVTF